MYYIGNIIVVALIVSLVGQISAANPGAALLVSQSGINEAQNIAVPILQNQLNKIPIPDLQTKVRILHKLIFKHFAVIQCYNI
mgnify:CR=1 FL=1